MRKQPKRVTKAVSASLPLDLLAQVDYWRENQRVRVGRSAVIRAALKEFMASHPLPEHEPCPKCSGQPASNDGFGVDSECWTCGRQWKESA